MPRVSRVMVCACAPPPLRFGVYDQLSPANADVGGISGGSVGCLRARIVAMRASEVTSYSCHLYVTSANAKLTRTRRNPAETRSMESTGKIRISDANSGGKLDRRISVAPMMDWTDRHCRYFLRGFSPDVLLYTEMIPAAAIGRGGRRAGRLRRDQPELRLSE